MSNAPRPTSPHLGIYRWQISMTLSIMHRIAGVALYAGALVIVAWLWMAAYAPADYATFHDYMASPLGQIALFGWTLAFYYHLGNGVRHLFWDIGKGFELKTMTATGWLVVLFALLMTMFTWGFIHTNVGTGL